MKLILRFCQGPRYEIGIGCVGVGLFHKCSFPSELSVVEPMLLTKPKQIHRFDDFRGQSHAGQYHRVGKHMIAQCDSQHTLPTPTFPSPYLLPSWPDGQSCSMISAV